jgi:hypothetical protein
MTTRGMEPIRIDVEGTRLRTVGLRRSGRPELIVQVKGSELVEEGAEFLRYVARYLMDSAASVRTGETLAYGCWLTRFEDEREEHVEIREHTGEGDAYTSPVHFALALWRDQHRLCEAHGASFSPPRTDQLVVISAGVYEGVTPIQGVRYPSPEHMSGWWVTTDLYNGDIKTLRSEHLHHVLANRPDVAPYMALPFGYRFNLGGETSYARFDQAVADSPP